MQKTHDGLHYVQGFEWVRLKHISQCWCWFICFVFLLGTSWNQMQLVRLRRFVLGDEQWKGTENAVCCTGNSTKSCCGTTIISVSMSFQMANWYFILCIGFVLYCETLLSASGDHWQRLRACQGLLLSSLFLGTCLDYDPFLLHPMFPGWNRRWRSPTVHFPCSGWKTEAWCDDARTFHVNSSECLVANCLKRKCMQTTLTNV